MTKDNRLVVIDGAAQKNRWDALVEACPTRMSEWGLKILRAGLDAHLGTIVVEPHYVCKDHRNLHSNFYSKKFQERSASCTRVHFFTKPGITRSNLLFNLPDLEEYYIG